jgi:transposase
MDLRRVINGIFYVNKTGCQWRMMPTDIGNGHTIYGYFRRWRLTGVWERVMETLHQWERQSQGRLPEPSACCAGGWGEAAAARGKKERFYFLSVGIGRQDPVSGSDRMAKIAFSDFRESSFFRRGSRLPSRRG